jgi:hypothetical protein
VRSILVKADRTGLGLTPVAGVGISGVGTYPMTPITRCWSASVYICCHDNQ